MEHSKHSMNSLFFLLIFGGRTGIWFKMCHEYLQVCFSMHGYVNGFLMSIYACLFMSVSLSMNVYQYFSGYTVLRYKDVYIIWCFEKL